MSCTSALTYKNALDRITMRSFCIYKRKKQCQIKLNQLIELLKLEKIDDLIFRGASEDLGFHQVFGGQVVAQSLSAAMQVAPAERVLHSCHAYFLAPGDSQHPIIYDCRNFT